MSQNQYSVYQLKPEYKMLRNKSFQYVINNQVKVVASNYRQVYMAKIPDGMTNMEVRNMLEDEPPEQFQRNVLMAGDVIIFTRDSVSRAYYVDTNDLIELRGFFQFNSSTSMITINTTGFIVEGLQGSWMATDEIVVDGKQFFLMESENQHRKTYAVVVDDQGHSVVKRADNGFDENALQQIRGYLNGQNPVVDHTRTPDGKIKLEIWQKYHENGEYLRSVESGTEQNYNMIDGISNNKRQTPEMADIQLPVFKQKAPAPENVKEKHIIETPKFRKSVLKKLDDAKKIVYARDGNKTPEQDKTDIERNRK